MSTEDNKAIVRRLYEEVFKKGNVAAVDELMAANLVDHSDFPTNAPLPAEFPFHLEAFKHFVPQWHTPNWQAGQESMMIATRLSSAFREERSC